MGVLMGIALAARTDSGRRCRVGSRLPRVPLFRVGRLRVDPCCGVADARGLQGPNWRGHDAMMGDGAGLAPASFPAATVSTWGAAITMALVPRSAAPTKTSSTRFDLEQATLPARRFPGSPGRWQVPAMASQRQGGRHLRRATRRADSRMGRKATGAPESNSRNRGTRLGGHIAPARRDG